MAQAARMFPVVSVRPHAEIEFHHMHLGTEQFAPFAEIFLAFSSETFVDGERISMAVTSVSASASRTSTLARRTGTSNGTMLCTGWIDHSHRAWRRHTWISAPHTDIGRHGTWL